MNQELVGLVALACLPGVASSLLQQAGCSLCKILERQRERERSGSRSWERSRIRDWSLRWKPRAGFKDNQGKYFEKRSSLVLLFLLSWLDKWASLNRIFRSLLCWEQTGLKCWDNSLRFNLTISSWDYTLGGINDSFSMWLHLHIMYPDNALLSTLEYFTPYSFDSVAVKHNLLFDFRVLQMVWFEMNSRSINISELFLSCDMWQSVELPSCFLVFVLLPQTWIFVLNTIFLLAGEQNSSMVLAYSKTGGLKPEHESRWSWDVTFCLQRDVLLQLPLGRHLWIFLTLRSNFVSSLGLSVFSRVQ